MSAFLQQLIIVDCVTLHHALFIFMIACVNIKGLYSFSFQSNNLNVLIMLWSHGWINEVVLAGKKWRSNIRFPGEKRIKI